MKLQPNVERGYQPKYDTDRLFEEDVLHVDGLIRKRINQRTNAWKSLARMYEHSFFKTVPAGLELSKAASNPPLTMAKMDEIMADAQAENPILDDLEWENVEVAPGIEMKVITNKAIEEDRVFMIDDKEAVFPLSRNKKGEIFVDCKFENNGGMGIKADENMVFIDFVEETTFGVPAPVRVKVKGVESKGPVA